VRRAVMQVRKLATQELRLAILASKQVMQAHRLAMQVHKQHQGVMITAVFSKQ
jgi:hypothetical protein